MKEIAPNLWRLRGFPPNGINVYLMGDVLVDAATRFAKHRILSQLKDRPLSLVALTHVHPDHQGAAKAVCEARKVPLACHEADVDAMEGRVPVQQAAPGNLINKLIDSVWTGPPHQVDRVLREGDEVAGFRVIHAPGHAAGEVIYFRDSDRVAVCGDVIRNISYATGLAGVAEPPDIFTVDPAENRRSIRKLLELEPSVACPGHGPPLTDLGALEKLVAGFD